MKYGLAVVSVLFLSACTTKTYVVSDKNFEGDTIRIVDARDAQSLRDKNTCQTHQIGDAQVIPNRLYLLQDAILKTNPLTPLEKVEISQFDIVVVKPRMCSLLQGSIMASVSYPAALAMAQSSGQDGVACFISGTVQGKSRKYETFKGDYEGVRSLYGAAASGKKIGITIKKLVEECAENFAMLLETARSET